MRNIFLPDGEPRSYGRYVGLLIGAAVLLLIAGWVMYRQFRIDVKTGEIAILIRKDGLNVRNDDEIAPTAEHRGIQKEFLTLGRHFRNPYRWDWEIHKEETIKEGELGILVSLTGDDLPYGHFLARLDENGNPTTKGIVPGVLGVGRYAIHPYLFKVLRDKPKIVPAGYKGVVTNLAGDLPDDPNVLLVPDGKRGVQKAALDPGTYYINPYEKRINLIDCRSQRFNLADNKDMGFPSKDGFWVSLDGIIEFRLIPERAAEVYVTYNDVENGEDIDEELVRMVILPNARSFCRLEGSNELGREFIQGETRVLFQEHFQKAMRDACQPLGIEIIQALITRIRPPQKIAEPVRLREIAKQEELQYKQQILQQDSEKLLAIEAEMVKQKQAVVKADQEVIKFTTEAMRQQEVDVTTAEQRQKVAEFKRDAAKDEAEAILSLGKAEAEVVRFQNQAEAAGWKKSVDAFSGNGAQFAEYVLFQKLAAAYREIMVNTADSPIMRVFETFGTPPTNDAKPGRTSPGAQPVAAPAPAERQATPEDAAAAK